MVPKNYGFLVEVGSNFIVALTINFVSDIMSANFSP